jgi:hypothetical protein
MNDLRIGQKYTRDELDRLFNTKHLRYCYGIGEVSAGIFIFVTLDKTKQKNQVLKYDDYFEDDLFHWDSKSIQTIESKDIKRIVNAEVPVNLFARVRAGIKQETNPYIYCGEVEYLDHDPQTSKPVHLIYLAKDYQDNPNPELKEIYDWRPGHGKVTTVKPISSKTKEKAKSRRQRGGQGFIKDPEDKKAVELWAMKIAREHYESLGYVVKDISANRGEAIDFECIKDGDIRFVEVKGTQGFGDEVMLYYTEIDKALSGNFHIDLFVVHSIFITKTDGVSVASGGIQEIYKDWIPDPNRLKPITYKYRLKP